MTAAEVIADILQFHGLGRVFCFPGGTISLLLDRLAFKGVEVVVARNEAAAGHMAQAAYRVTGKPQVFIVTSGPGATNAVTPIADAYYDSDAIILLAGQVATTDMRPGPEMRQQGFQETPTTKIMTPISKLAFCPWSAFELVAHVNAAFGIATKGRPGPVVIECPMDVMKSEVQFVPRHNGVADMPLPDKNVLQRGREMIRDARNPVIVAGRGALGAVDQLRAFSVRYNIPVVNSMPACGIMPTGHPLALGMLGHTGQLAANRAVAAADLIIGLGTRLDVRQTGSAWSWWREKAVIRVDVDKAELRHGRVQASVDCQCTVADWLGAMG